MTTLTLWRITGEATTDSSGGVETWIYVTTGPLDVPELHQAIPSGGRERNWYQIDRIECLGSIPAAIPPDSPLVAALTAEAER